MRRPPDKHIGAQAELVACAFLLGEGFDVFRNVSSSGTADLIACKGDKVLRIDVKSGRTPKLTLTQEKEGVVILHVGEDGHCEFASERRGRINKQLQTTLAEIANMSPQDGADHLNQRGITTPNGGRWNIPTVVVMRQRLETGAPQ